MYKFSHFAHYAIRIPHKVIHLAGSRRVTSQAIHNAGAGESFSSQGDSQNNEEKKGSGVKRKNMVIVYEQRDMKS